MCTFRPESPSLENAPHTLAARLCYRTSRVYDYCWSTVAVGRRVLRRRALDGAELEGI
jgi:hypothetical protein